jgi:hypothetical protein
MNHYIATWEQYRNQRAHVSHRPKYQVIHTYLPIAQTRRYRLVTIERRTHIAYDSRLHHTIGPKGSIPGVDTPRGGSRLDATKVQETTMEIGSDRHSPDSHRSRSKEEAEMIQAEGHRKMGAEGKGTAEVEDHRGHHGERVKKKTGGTGTPNIRCQDKPQGLLLHHRHHHHHQWYQRYYPIPTLVARVSHHLQ